VQQPLLQLQSFWQQIHSSYLMLPLPIQAMEITTTITTTTIIITTITTTTITTKTTMMTITMMTTTTDNTKGKLVIWVHGSLPERNLNV
jgi:hypothetical protein